MDVKVGPFPVDPVGMDEPMVPEVLAAYPGVDFTVPTTVVTPLHAGKGAPPPRVRIGEALISAGILTPEQLEECLADQRRGGQAGADRRLGAIIVAKGMATEDDIAAGLSAITGFDHVHPVDMPLSPAVVRLVPHELAAELRLVPIDAGPTWIKVAAADPFDRRSIDAVRDATGRPSVSMAVATSASVLLALEAAWEREPDDDTASPGASEDSAPGHLSADPGSDPGSATGSHPGWEYAFVGDDLPSEHAGYTPDVTRLDRRLGELGAAGWEAVGMTTHGGRVRVLLKRSVRS